MPDNHCYTPPRTKSSHSKRVAAAADFGSAGLLATLECNTWDFHQKLTSKANTKAKNLLGFFTKPKTRADTMNLTSGRQMKASRRRLSAN